MISLSLLVPLFLAGPPSISVPDPGVAAPPLRPAQDDEEAVEDEREDVKDRLDALRDHVKRKGEEDDRAIQLIDELLEEYPELGPKDRAAVVKGLAAALKAKRRDREPDVPEDRLFMACATALGLMGPESVPTLLTHLDGKTHRRNVRLQVAFAESLGRTQDPKGIAPLLKLLDHRHAELQAAAANALRSYEGLEQDERKKVFKEVLDVLTAQKAKKDADVTDQEAFERYNTISGAFVRVLQHLSGHDENEPEAWRSWWNDNKREDWDA